MKTYITLSFGINIWCGKELTRCKVMNFWFFIFPCVISLCHFYHIIFLRLPVTSKMNLRKLTGSTAKLWLFSLSIRKYGNKKWRAITNEGFPESGIFNGQPQQWIELEWILMVSEMAVLVFVWAQQFFYYGSVYRGMQKCPYKCFCRFKG